MDHSSYPWSFDAVSMCVRDGHGTVIGEVVKAYFVDRDTAHANGLMFARSPEYRAELKKRSEEVAKLKAQNAELLEALKSCVAEMDCATQFDGNTKPFDNARAAIAKAEGADQPPETPERGEFEGYKVSLSCDPVYYGSECTDADAERIFGNLSELIRSQFPGIQVVRWDDTRRSSATTGPDESVCDEIHQWIADNWTKAL